MTRTVVGRRRPPAAVRRAAVRTARSMVEPLEGRRYFASLLDVYVSSTADYADPMSALQSPSLVPSLRDALSVAASRAADGSGELTEIHLTAGATYAFTADPGVYHAGYTPVAAVTPAITGVGSVIIDGDGASVDLSQATGQELLSAAGVSNVYLSNLTVQGRSNLLGGALSAYGSAYLSTTNVTFRNDTATGTTPNGGSNGATAKGGAVYFASGNTTASPFTNDTFTGDAAVGAPGNQGGQSTGYVGGSGQGGAVAIGASGNVAFANVTFSGDSATGGQTDEANDNDGVNAGVQDTASAAGQGGAVYAGSASNVTFTNSTLSGNTATGRTGPGPPRATGPPRAGPSTPTAPARWSSPAGPSPAIARSATPATATSTRTTARTARRPRAARSTSTRPDRPG